MPEPWIIGLDLATRSGICEGDGSKLPEVDHVQLPGAADGDRGPMFHTFRRWIEHRIERARPRGRVLVIHEQPILPKAFIKWIGGKPQIIYPTKLETTLTLQGLVGVLEELCYGMGVELAHVDVPSVKKEVTGRGDADKTDMTHIARKVGLNVTVDDEADAFGVWLLGLRSEQPRLSEKFDALIWGSRGGLL